MVRGNVAGESLTKRLLCNFDSSQEEVSLRKCFSAKSMSTPRDSTCKPWVVDHSIEKSFQDPFFPVPFLATGDRRLPTFQPPTRFQPWSMLHVLTRLLRNDSYRRCCILRYLRIGSILFISWIFTYIEYSFLSRYVLYA